MLGCTSRAEIRASCWKRFRMPGRASVSGRRILTATGRSRRSSKPSNTLAMPPSPRSAWSRYRPPIIPTTARACTRVVYPSATGTTPTLDSSIGYSCDQDVCGGLGPSGGAVPPFGQDRHLAHDGDNIRRRLVAEVAVKGADVGDHPLGFAPTGVGAEVDVERR